MRFDLLVNDDPIVERQHPCAGIPGRSFARGGLSLRVGGADGLVRHNQRRTHPSGLHSRFLPASDWV
jgi:hypothetical protein